jgi:hypothetical protein
MRIDLTYIDSQGEEHTTDGEWPDLWAAIVWAQVTFGAKSASAAPSAAAIKEAA